MANTKCIKHNFQANYSCLFAPNAIMQLSISILAVVLFLYMRVMLRVRAWAQATASHSSKCVTTARNNANVCAVSIPWHYKLQQLNGHYPTNRSLSRLHVPLGSRIQRNWSARLVQLVSLKSCTFTLFFVFLFSSALFNSFRPTIELFITARTRRDAPYAKIFTPRNDIFSALQKS